MQLIGESHILRFGRGIHVCVARMVLASVNAVGLISLRRAVTRRFGRPAGFMFVLLSITQFHLPFWMGRTLPNMFALLPGQFAIHFTVSSSPSHSSALLAANMALRLLIDRAPNSTRPSKSNIHWAIALLTFATVVFRSELLLLLGPLALQAIVRYTSLTEVIKVGLVSGILSVGKFLCLTASNATDEWRIQLSLCWSTRTSGSSGRSGQSCTGSTSTSFKARARSGA